MYIAYTKININNVLYSVSIMKDNIWGKCSFFFFFFYCNKSTDSFKNVLGKNLNYI